MSHPILMILHRKTGHEPRGFTLMVVHLMTPSHILKGEGGSGGLPIFGATKRCAISTDTQSRFASVVLDGVLGPLYMVRQT